MSDYTGKKVYHPSLKEGIVTNQDSEKIWVKFSNGTYIFGVPEALQNGFIYLIEDFSIPSEEIARDSMEKDTRDPNYYRKLYQKRFQEYLEGLDDDHAKNSISTYKSDAFFIESHYLKKDFMFWFSSEDALEQAREVLVELPEIKNGQQKPSRRANGYITAMRYLRNFFLKEGII